MDLLSQQTDSPGLNNAIIETRGGECDGRFKRKSIDLASLTCKKRLLDPMPLPDWDTRRAASPQPAQQVDDNDPLWPVESEFFQTQFLRQVDVAIGSDNAAVVDVAGDEFPNLSQMFAGGAMTQFEADPPPVPLNLTQLFTDDVATDDDDVELPQSSQIFIDNIRAAHETIGVVSQRMNVLKNATTTNSAVFHSINNASAYIQKQRSMSLENEANLNDDDICLDPFLSQAYKSTQYRRELEAVFANCEKSVCEGMDELKENDVDSNAAKNISLDSQDWAQSFSEPPPLPPPPLQLAEADPSPFTTPTKFVRQRLSARRSGGSGGGNSTISPNSSTFLAPPKLKSANSYQAFTPLGPFYGLPLKVKGLIRDYKGIHELYGECIFLNIFFWKYNFNLINMDTERLAPKYNMYSKTLSLKKKNYLFTLN